MTVTLLHDRWGQRIFHGDTLEGMAMLEAAGERFDLILTSPPYNLGVSAGGGVRNVGKSTRWKAASKTSAGANFTVQYPNEFNHKTRGGTLGGLSQGYDTYGDDRPMAEYVVWQQDCLRAMWRLLSDVGAIYYNHKPRHWAGRIILPTEYVPAELMPYHRQEVVLRRGGGVCTSQTFYTPSQERIEIFAKPEWRLKDRGWTVCDVWDMPVPSGNPHPAPFDLSIPQRALATTCARRVLDPFMGSGTTLVAAQAMGVEGTGIELSRAFCNQALDRLAQPPLVASDNHAGATHLPGFDPEEAA